MITKYQLKNKMSVLLIESRKSPVVSVQMWVNNGSADERKGEEGISHFIEHLVFKGTKKYNVGEIAKTVEGSGGELNAYTSFDQTVFYVTISSQFSEVALSVISEMMLNPRFDPTEIENEKEVVIEEIKRSNDSPSRQASRLLFQTMYSKHAYGIPVIGYEDVIRQMKPEHIVEYYNTRYIPPNMKLVVVGDFDSAEMKKKLAPYFDVKVERKLRVPKRMPEPKKRASRIAVKKTNFQETYIHLTWPLPNGFHKDVPALDVFAMIFGQGESSRLTRTIKMKNHLVNSVGASSFTPKDAGLFSISATMNDKNIQAYLDGVRAELKEFFASGPTQEELSKAVLNVESEKYFSLETVDGMAGLYGHFDFFFGDYRKFTAIMKQMAGLTTEDIVKTAKKYLDPKLIHIAGMTNGDEKKLKAMLASFANSLRKDLKAVGNKKIKAQKAKPSRMKWKMDAAKKKTKPEYLTLKNGVRVIIQEQHETPVVQLKSAIMGGLRYEDPKKAGVNELLSRVWTAGIKGKSEAEISLILESTAASISAFGGRNSVGLSMTALEPFAAETFDLFAKFYSEPTFEAEAVEREKGMMLESLRSREDNAAQKCILNMTRELFGTHPYGRDPLGSKEAVSALSRTTVQDYYKNVANPEKMVISVVGPINGKEWAKRIQAAFETMPKIKFDAPPIEKPFLPSKRETFEKLEKEQTHIALVHPGISLLDKKRFALEVMQSILSGQGGRLFIELRDKLSLAYSVSPLRLDGIDSGYFGAYIGCSPEKADKAVEMMRKELYRFRTELVGDKELEHAKRYLTGRNAIGNQRTSQMASLALFDELYGLPRGEHEHYTERIAAVTAADLKSIANQIFEQPEVLSIVGPKNVSK